MALSRFIFAPLLVVLGSCDRAATTRAAPVLSPGQDANVSCAPELDTLSGRYVGGAEQQGSNDWFGSIDMAVLVNDSLAIVADNRRKALHLAGRGVHDIIGRAGDGPGEFRSVSWVEAVDDTIIAYDWVKRRFTALNLSGRPLSSWPGSGGLPVGRPAPGITVVRESVVKPPHSSKASYTDTFELRLHHESHPSQRGQTLGTHVGVERYFDQSFGMNVWLAPLRQQSSFGARNQLIWIADPRVPAILVTSGDRHWTIAIQSLARQLDRTQIRRFEEAVIAQSRDSAAARSMLRDLGVPPGTPAFGLVHLDRLNRFWIRQVALPTDRSSLHSIYDASDGRYFGIVNLPTGWTAVDATSRTVLAVPAEWNEDLRIALFRFQCLGRS